MLNIVHDTGIGKRYTHAQIFHLVKYLAEKQFLYEKHYKKKQSPYEKVPVCPVPQSCKHPDCEHGKYHSQPALSIPAHRYIHILTEPSAKCDMPAPPENLSKSVPYIRILELGLEAEDQADSIAITEYPIKSKAAGTNIPRSRAMP